MAKKKATRRRSAAPRRAPARRRKATSSIRRPRSRRSEGDPIMSILLGVGGAMAAAFLSNSGSVQAMIPDPKIRALATTGVGALVATQTSGQMQAIGLGMAIAGGATTAQLLIPSASQTVGALSRSQAQALRARVRASNLNGIPRGVLTGTGQANGGNIPKGVIVGMHRTR